VNRVRTAFLETTDVAVELVRSPEVAARWDEPSALEHWSVRGLAGHLVRNSLGVEEYLDAEPDPEGPPGSPAVYYGAVLDSTDLHSDLHRGIRERGERMAADGYGALVEKHSAGARRLRARLETQPPERKVKVFEDQILVLDDYLVTRLVELTCHIDDLAVSVGVPTPNMPLEALDSAIRALVSIARYRHGDVAVIRALARRERDTVDALHVL
jgi:uncharacterized protein (TIGR03083 family)